MASEPRTIEVEPGSEVDRLLDEATQAPLRLVRGGDEFRLDYVAGNRPATPGERTGGDRDGDDESLTERLKQPPSAQQVARSIEGIRRAAGGWAGLVDAEELKAYVRERRRTSSRPPVRW